MRTLDAISVSGKICENLDQQKKQLIDDFKLNGFVNVDGALQQYNPVTYSYNPISDVELKQYINKSIQNKWSILSDNQLIKLLENELPYLKQSEVNNYSNYIQQHKISINDAELEQQISDAINENKETQNLKMKSKGKKNLMVELQLLRNNNIFVAKRNLYQYRDGSFNRFTSADVMKLFNTEIGNKEIHFVPQEIKNNWSNFTSNLIDITPVINTLKIKQKRDDTLSICENDYKKVVKIVKQYV